MSALFLGSRGTRHGAARASGSKSPWSTRLRLSPRQPRWQWQHRTARPTPLLLLASFFLNVDIPPGPMVHGRSVETQVHEVALHSCNGPRPDSTVAYFSQAYPKKQPTCASPSWPLVGLRATYSCNIARCSRISLHMGSPDPTSDRSKIKSNEPKTNLPKWPPATARKTFILLGAKP